ncbi:hypothetical protein P8H26_01975 [Pseudochrobactrum sp. sp1633]|uniref:hypothetical protein n=1 Tax=Pseudochrobactrum sp. sp1633 TaxID=3036706 RepID=UPI0025A53B2A|nr:hypothetical protein [Pseudochrobactrum sp. sp1633]MDM8344154.1 hypothetical protein [Pseudochrobactrum sp. sp1633]
MTLNHVERIEDLKTVSGLIGNLVSDHLSIVSDLNGQQVIIISAKHAERIHLLARDMERRVCELSEGEAR